MTEQLGIFAEHGDAWRDVDPGIISGLASSTRPLNASSHRNHRLSTPSMKWR
jgi:hypothetical protein